MKTFLILALLVPCSVCVAQSDQKKVEQAVYDWAKATFEFFDAPRFEKFEPIPSPEYFALSMQRQNLVEFKEEIKFNFQEGKSDRTKEKLKEIL